MESKTPDLRVKFLSLRNTVDYQLRNLLRYSRPLKEDAPIPAMDFRVQNEFKEFLNLFRWEEILSSLPEKGVLRVADVGARNFCFAPVIDECFKSIGRELQLSGIEIDSYRRLSNFHTRFDYGMFYANLCRHAEFHPIDFLKFNQTLDFAFLLNPFVTNEPTVRWGLPLSALKPSDFFAHAYRLLEPKKGIALVSSPSIEEFELVLEFALKQGFKLGPPEEEVVWRPHERSQQKKPRYGIVLYSKLS